MTVMWCSHACRPFRRGESHCQPMIGMHHVMMMVQVWHASRVVLSCLLTLQKGRVTLSVHAWHAQCRDDHVKPTAGQACGPVMLADLAKGASHAVGCRGRRCRSYWAVFWNGDRKPDPGAGGPPSKVQQHSKGYPACACRHQGYANWQKCARGCHPAYTKGL